MKIKESQPHQPLTGKSLELLQAINEAASTFQRSAHSETAVFHAFQEQMAALSLRGGISLFDESRNNLIVKTVNYAGRIGRILKKFEQMVGIKTENFTFAVSDVDAYHQVIQTGQTQYINDSSIVIAQMLPKSAQRYLGRLIMAFGSDPAIYAPIISSEGKVQGVINIVGDGLTQGDVPALTAFANHIAVALDNAYLFEKIQQHTTLLEQRVAERTAELAVANERLTELDRLKTRLISNVSHELRTPITALELYLKLYKKGKPEKKDHYLNIVEEQASRLKQLVDEILDLSRLDVGHDKFDFAPVQINDVVEQVVTMLAEQARVKGIAIYFNPEVDLPIIQGISSQLSQVVMNLVTNSINYSDSGQIQVITFNSDDSTKICLQISDTGRGIPLADQPHIFDRFYRGQFNEQGTSPGTGLGLAIVKEIVEIHSGSIELESEVGTGTRFSIWLPVSQSN